MKTYNRAYNEEQGDFRRIVDFFIESKEISKNTSFCLQRFIDWKYGLYPPRTKVSLFWSKNAQLWFDGFDKLIGFVISENGGTDFNIITTPGYRFMFKEIIEWVIKNWKNRGDNFSIELTEFQDIERKIIESYHFTHNYTAYKRQFDLTTEIYNKFTIEDGYYIIDMETNPEYREQRILRANAFDGIENISEEELNYQLEFYNNTHNSPTYHAYTDLCVKAQDGIHVACCEALINCWNQEAEIERICTHQNYRRKGFARVVIQECLHRLKEMGIKTAYITGYSQEAINLYGSLGAKNELKVYIYKRDVKY